jgi:hypothetical protein
MATKSADDLEKRLHDTINNLLWRVDAADLLDDCAGKLWGNGGYESCVDLDGVHIDKSGSVSVGLVRTDRATFSIEDILALAGDDDAAEIRGILEEIRNRPAPALRQKAKRAPSRG